MDGSVEKNPYGYIFYLRFIFLYCCAMVIHLYDVGEQILSRALAHRF